MYEQIIIDCVRYFNFTNMDEIKRLTLYEYDLLKRGKQLQILDEESQLYKLAWLNRQVNKTQMEGKKETYVFKKFKDFYNYDKMLESLTCNTVSDNKIKDSKARELMLLANRKE